ncbi:signal recognition particle-docking protein FtsY [Candidatus Pantoea edessiphila]|uniref:Signal recognition particle receptor FtsY n=1 Tax=Candidatus Pantoea edessiphila TaxID=2044610 RepID=A0A2P5SXV5_9GAMM|nr:signal recognition particle-docking protein FtsY [Candidatus Pantoea edessiphila]MBK4775758.1 signal recognition particle-docking protein FtsY [Pantoea sp. Edef]PPI87154.1 signal recognition particle-docking protein FtsY [Candidatus Pantoea edessiphila]
MVKKKNNNLFSWFKFKKNDSTKNENLNDTDHLLSENKKTIHINQCLPENKDNNKNNDSAHNAIPDSNLIINDIDINLVNTPIKNKLINGYVKSTKAEIQSQHNNYKIDTGVNIQPDNLKKKQSFFTRLKNSLIKTHQNLAINLNKIFYGNLVSNELFEKLEEQLLISDIGIETTQKIIKKLSQQASIQRIKEAKDLYDLLKIELTNMLVGIDIPIETNKNKPFVILVVGVNGVGKTTTIGKLAHYYKKAGKSVMLAAGDTFRIAAVEQLQFWGKYNKIPVISQPTGSDSSSVIFDAIQSAKSRNIDIIIADTAGRLHNKLKLMEELKKTIRVIKKIDKDAPHEIMLTIDANTGQNSVIQAKMFNQFIKLTGITITKLDGTAKGGVIFSIANQLSIPIRYICIGETVDDIKPFKSSDFIEAIFSSPN